MSLNAMRKKQEIRIDKRRALISSLLLRKPGISQRQICDKLEVEGFVNPDTGDAYSLGTINSDVQALQQEWRQTAAEEVAEWKAQQIAQLHEIYREAWQQKDLRAAMQAIKMQGDIIGTEAPKRQEITGADGEAAVTIRVVHDRD